VAFSTKTQDETSTPEHALIMALHGSSCDSVTFEEAAGGSEAEVKLDLCVYTSLLQYEIIPELTAPVAIGDRVA
jgi:hypothetical protein